MNWLMFLTAVAASTIVASFTDWLFFGVLFHDRAKATPEIWVATAGQVADWWRTRAGVQLREAPDGRSVTLTNRGRKPFGGGVMIVDAPDGARRHVQLPELAPGQSIVVDHAGAVIPGAASDLAAR